MTIALPDGYRHIAHGDVGSTNTLCLEHARQHGVGNVWISGTRQIEGRGSRGRGWVSEPGNLYASLLLKDCGEQEWLHTLTFVASLAIRDAILSLHGAALSRVELKWPNDVLVNGAKVSGILLESHQVNDVRYVIIGIGINIIHYPAETLFPATSLEREGVVCGFDQLFQILADAMAIRIAQWSGGSGFAQIRADWLKAAARLDRQIEVKSSYGAEMAIKGVFRGLSEKGLLLLEMPDGSIKTVSTADIFFA